MSPDEASGGKGPGGAIAAGVTSPADPAGRLSPRLVVALIVGLWLCYFVLVSARSAVMGFPTDWPMVSRRITVTAASEDVDSHVRQVDFDLAGVLDLGHNFDIGKTGLTFSLSVKR